jgi:hypothetical protein
MKANPYYSIETDDSNNISALLRGTSDADLAEIVLFAEFR